MVNHLSQIIFEDVHRFWNIHLTIYHTAHTEIIFEDGLDNWLSSPVRHRKETGHDRRTKTKIQTSFLQFAKSNRPNHHTDIQFSVVQDMKIDSITLYLTPIEYPWLNSSTNFRLMAVPFCFKLINDRLKQMIGVWASYHFISYKTLVFSSLH